MSEFKHYSVLLHETVDGLNIRPDGIYVDGTLGGGGHAHEVCTHLSPAGRLIGIDQDKDAIQAASERLSDVRDRVTIVRSNYERIDDVLKELGKGRWDLPRSRCIELPAGYCGAWLQLPERRTARYADG